MVPSLEIPAKVAKHLREIVCIQIFSTSGFQGLSQRLRGRLQYKYSASVFGDVSAVLNVVFVGIFANEFNFQSFHTTRFASSASESAVFDPRLPEFILNMSTVFNTIYASLSV